MREVFALFQVSGEAPATQKDEITVPGAPEPEAKLQQPGYKAWALHAVLQIRVCVLVPECGLSLFQKTLLQPF